MDAVVLVFSEKIEQKSLCHLDRTRLPTTLFHAGRLVISYGLGVRGNSDLRYDHIYVAAVSSMSSRVCIWMCDVMHARWCCFALPT